MPLNFTKTLDQVDYSKLVEMAILEISPHIETGKDLEGFRHLIVNTIFTNQFADEEKGHEHGVWVLFELQTPVPRKDVIDGKEATLFIRQFSTFYSINQIPYLKKSLSADEVVEKNGSFVSNFFKNLFKEIRS